MFKKHCTTCGFSWEACRIIGDPACLKTYAKEAVVSFYIQKEVRTFKKKKWKNQKKCIACKKTKRRKPWAMYCTECYFLVYPPKTGNPKYARNKGKQGRKKQKPPGGGLLAHSD